MVLQSRTINREHPIKVHIENGACKIKTRGLSIPIQNTVRVLLFGENAVNGVHSVKRYLLEDGSPS